MLPSTADWKQQEGKPQPQIDIHRPVSRLFFSFPTFDDKTTKLHLHAEKLTGTVLHLNLGHFVGFFVVLVFVLCSFVLLYVSPLMRQLQNNIWGTISRIGGWGTNTKIIKTVISLHLNLEFFFLMYIFSFIYLFFIFILIFLFIFYFQSSLCLSNAFAG
jgi:hypothetical protein